MADKTDKPLHPVAVFAALLVMVAWLTMLSRLVYIAGSAEEREWVRMFAVLASLEAVAFGAAGALFGTTIQRQRVQEAQARAEKAEGAAAVNAQAAANGKALAAAVKARQGTRTPEGLERVSAGDSRRSGPDQELVALAERLFPD